jgi:fatty acid desaturase
MEIILDSKPNREAAKLVQPSFFQWVSRVLWEWTLIAVILWAARRCDHWLAYYLCLFPLATRQHALGILGHDGAHYTASKSRLLNDAAASVLSLWPLGIGLEGYRRFHFKHHQLRGTTEDPELRHKVWAAPEWATPMTLSRLCAYLAKDCMGFAVRDIIRVIQIVRPAAARDIIGPIILWVALLIVLHSLGGLWIAALWWISINSTYWAVFRIRMWTEHTGTTGTHRTSAAFWQKWLFMPHNTWCHYEHHEWPGIPCWNLPKARELDGKEPIRSASEVLKGYREHPPTPYGHPAVEIPK